MVILDTNIIIDHLRQYPRNKKSALDKISKKIPQDELFLTVISIQELFTGASTRDKRTEKWIFEVISPFQVVSYNGQVAKLAGEIERDLGRPIEFPDAAIAATTILNKARLFTLNIKDFKGVKGLKFV